MVPFSTRREGIADDDSKNQRTIRRITEDGDVEYGSVHCAQT